MIVRQQYGRVGDPVNGLRDLFALPIGGVMGDNTNNYRKVGYDLWERVGSESQKYRSAQFNGGRYRVTALPEGFEPREKPQETVESYMFWFRDNALAMAIQHGVSYNASEEAVREMGVTSTTVPLGAGVQIRNQTSLQDMPPGTTVWTGDPDQPDTFGVWVKGTGRTAWTQVLGKSSSMNEVVTVASINGSIEPPDWLTREATDEDRQAILQFRAKAWRVGWNLKRAQGWCSTYESVMHSLGLSSSAIREAQQGQPAIGVRYPPDGAVAVPIGTVFRWQSQERPEEWALYLRLASMENDNMAGTRLIGGTTQSKRNYRSSMAVYALPPENPGPRAEGLAMWPFDADIVNAMPPGTLFNTTEGGPGYIIARDGRATTYNQGMGIPAEGRWVGRDFGTPGHFYYYGWDGVVQ